MRSKVERSSKAVFRAEAPRQCKLEINMNNVVGDSKVLTARCRWNRTVSVSAECQNSDGCVGNRCESRQMSRDKMTTTSVHLNDHTL